MEVALEDKPLPERDLYQFSQDYAMMKVVRPSPHYQEALSQAQSEGRPFTDKAFPPCDRSLGLHDLNYIPQWRRVGELYPGL